MTDWYPVDPSAKRKALERGLGECRIQGKRICIAHHQGSWYAVGARCPHAGGPLAGGHLDETGAVVCPWHRFGFDLKTGQSDSGGYYVPTYAIREQQGQLQVGLKSKQSFWKRLFGPSAKAPPVDPESPR